MLEGLKVKGLSESHVKLILMQAVKTEYSDQELDEFKALLHSRLKRAQKQTDLFQEQLTEMAENGDKDYDLDDFGSLAREREFIQVMLERQHKHIEDLEDALLRIRNKTYGICEFTGALIDRRKLLAVPTMTRCVTAEHALGKTAPEEQEGKAAMLGI